MLNIEVIKFEAQDVITASGTVAAPTKKCEHQWNGQMVGANPEKTHAKVICKHCGANGLYEQGKNWNDPSSFTWED